MGWNAAWSSSPDKPVWALPGRSLSSQWTPQSEPIECVHHMQLQGDAGPNMIWFACMVVQRLSQQEPWSKYRASTFFSEIRERPLKLHSIYIHSLCPLRHSMAQKVVEESGLTFEYTPCLSILSHKPVFWDISPDLILSSFTAPDRYVIAALSGTYLPFRFQPGSLTFSPPRHSGVWVFAKLEISGGDITGVLIKLRCHSLKGYHQHHLDEDLLWRQKSEVAELPFALPANTALKAL